MGGDPTALIQLSLQRPRLAFLRELMEAAVERRLYARDVEAAHATLTAAAAHVDAEVEILPLPFLPYRRVKIQGRGRVGDWSTVQAFPYCLKF